MCVCLSVCLPACLSVCMYVHMYVCIGLEKTQGIARAPGGTCRILSAAITKAWSPSWHRRLRKKRSVIRQRVRLQLPVSHRDRSLLARHHGTCPDFEQALVSMGKRGEKWGQYNGYYSYDSRSWAAWPGPKSKPQNNTAAPEFPSYDVEWKQQDIAPVEERRHVVEQQKPSTFTKKVQAAVNIARKQDVKVAKLTEDQAVKERRWKAYTVKMQQAFMQEHAKHRSNLSKLKHELSDALEAQASAQQQLKEVLAEALRGDGQQGSHTAMWEALMAGHKEMDVEEDLQEDEALLYAQRFMQSAARTAEQEHPGLPQFGAGSAAPTTPPHRRSPGLPMTPPAVAAYVPPKTVDPYMVSPGTAAMAAASIAGSPDMPDRMNNNMDAATNQAAAEQVEEVRPEGPHRPPGPKQRSPVKAIPKIATAPLQGPGLSGKLEARRALIPFGGPGGADNGALSTEGHGPPRGPVFHVLDEGDAELFGHEPTDLPGAASPGLGRLE